MSFSSFFLFSPLPLLLPLPPPPLSIYLSIHLPVYQSINPVLLLLLVSLSISFFVCIHANVSFHIQVCCIYLLSVRLLSTYLLSFTYIHACSSISCFTYQSIVCMRYKIKYKLLQCMYVCMYVCAYGMYVRYVGVVCVYDRLLLSPTPCFPLDPRCR